MRDGYRRCINRRQIRFRSSVTPPRKSPKKKDLLDPLPSASPLELRCSLDASSGAQASRVRAWTDVVVPYNYRLPEGRQIAKKAAFTRPARFLNIDDVRALNIKLMAIALILKQKKKAFPFSDKELCKYFEPGNHVKVVSGATKGSSSLVFSVEGHVVKIVSDTTKELVGKVLRMLKVSNHGSYENGHSPFTKLECIMWGKFDDIVSAAATKEITEQL
ncbi:hypothetical protein CASFOL_020161 [Castilleja foliolosa]|uniref:Spt5 KOW domain-containing protein n=1 Tax=Castilleja foliolosa TaxID=1961234 RepID=A0ABD3D2U3_9LAMI